MSEQLYYLRFRGRISGPFTVAQLHALHQRGQFGRFHEVSEDRSSWKVASSLEHLFPAAPTRGDTSEVISAVRFPEERDLAGWYYLDAAGEQRGPVSRDRLEDLRRAGEIGSRSLVYREGMPAWTPLDRIDLGGPPARATSSLDSWEETQGWRRVRTGVTLLLVSVFISAGALFLLAFGLLIAVAGESPGGVFVTALFCYVIGFASRVVEAVGDGFLAAAPRTFRARGIAIAAFVLALVWPLFYVLLVPGRPWSVDVFLLHADRRLLDAWEVLVLAGSSLAFVLDAVRVVLVQRFLQAVAARLREQELARTLAMLVVIYAILWGLLLLAVGVWAAAGVALWNPRESGGLVVLLVLFWVIALSGTVLAIFWFVRFLIALFQVRALISRAALRE